MATRTLTDANAVIIINSPDVFPGSPLQLQQFAADDMFTASDLDTVEAMMGVDGLAAFGYTPKLFKWDVMLMASSLSIDALEQIQSSQVQNNAVYVLSGSVYLKSVNKRYVMTTGAMTGYSPMSSAKAVLQPRKFSFTWQSVFPNLTS